MTETASLSPSAPRPLVVAAVVTLVEALAFVGLAINQGIVFSSERAEMGWTTIAFFAIWALMLAACGAAILRHNSWARSPIVMAQLIHLGVAWSFVAKDPSRGLSIVAWCIAAASATVLVGLFHPKSIRHLAAMDA